MIIRAKTQDLISLGGLTPQRKANSELNNKEITEKKTILESYPKRLVFELTNACNLNCIMCGRNAAAFKKTAFDIRWLPIFNDIMPKIEEVTLMGWGEPTIHPQFEEILKILDGYGVRKYFCTNGTRLDALIDGIFKYNVEVIAVSIDGSDAQTNERIRRGMNFNKTIKSLKKIVARKRAENTAYPYMNFVTTIMKDNFRQLPDIVRLAGDIGLEEVKVVYLTAFDEKFLGESLFDRQDEVRVVFETAKDVAEQMNIKIKLPYIQGEDISGDMRHKQCFAGWRDFFIGSDGYIRSCMSTPKKLFHINKYSSFDEMWNSEEYVEFRSKINTENELDSCKLCYQSSYANWNKKHAFIQIDNNFSPDWEKK